MCGHISEKGAYCGISEKLMGITAKGKTN